MIIVDRVDLKAVIEAATITETVTATRGVIVVDESSAVVPVPEVYAVAVTTVQASVSVVNATELITLVDDVGNVLIDDVGNVLVSV